MIKSAKMSQIKPIINPISKQALSLLMRDLPQSLLLTGPIGVGLGTIAEYICDELADITLTVLPEKNDKIDIEKGIISVDSVRQLYNQTRSIQTGKLIIVIDYAERMAHQAQNAFLKLLEEPRTGVYFILVSHTPSNLLPTVMSRVRMFEFRPLSHKQTEEFIDSLGVKNAQKRSQLLFMADGLPAELVRLISDEDYFESKAQIVRDARDLLQGTPYKKLLISNKYKDSREDALMLLTTSMSILTRSISEKPEPTLIGKIDLVQYTYQQIYGNGNVRLCLARLVL